MTPSNQWPEEETNFFMTSADFECSLFDYNDLTFITFFKVTLVFVTIHLFLLLSHLKFFFRLMFQSSTKSTLQKHIAVIHNKEKPYKCQLCPNATFGQKAHLVSLTFWPNFVFENHLNDLKMFLGITFPAQLPFLLSLVLFLYHLRVVCLTQC